MFLCYFPVHMVPVIHISILIIYKKEYLEVKVFLRMNLMYQEKPCWRASLYYVYLFHAIPQYVHSLLVLVCMLNSFLLQVQ
jgi:hypothetical protein